jgi:hypothetical protein
MSAAVRKAVVDKLFFQSSSERQDILNESVVKTELVGLLEYLQAKGYYIEITAVTTDHHPDGYLSSQPGGAGTHQYGWAVDCWPLNSAKPGDYMDQTTHSFRQFLKDATGYPYTMQVGLGGAAFLQANMDVLCAYGFQDDGSDHVHLGTKPG